MAFGTIWGPLDPEEFSWEVKLGEEQELVQIDEQWARVRYEDGTPALTINAEPAHDSTGANVPTTLRVSEGKVITLTVHHRAGNPAAGGAPFTYPVSAGAGYVVGSETPRLIEPAKDAPPSLPLPTCVVPRLTGKSLKASRVQLRQAGCKLGKVRGKWSKTAKVVKQGSAPGAVLGVDAEVGVKIAG